MAFENWGPGAGAIAQGTGGLFSTIWNASNRNWLANREDTAVQRRVADMEKAGINPIMAAGAAASSSAPIKLDNPDVGQGVLGALQLKSQMEKIRSEINMNDQNIATSAAIEKVHLANASNIAADTELKGTTSQGILSTIERNRVMNTLTKSQTALNQHNLKISKEIGIRTNQTGLVTELIALVKAIWGQGRQEGSPILEANRWIDDKIDKAKKIPQNYVDWTSRAENAIKILLKTATGSMRDALINLQEDIRARVGRTTESRELLNEATAAGNRRRMMPYIQ